MEPQPPQSQHTATASPVTPSARWFHSVWFVLLMLFVVMGPFGLPLLWKSPRFSRPLKIALTVLVVVYTVWILAASFKLVSGLIHDLEALPTLH